MAKVDEKAANPAAVDYRSMIAPQDDVVKKLADEFAKTPSDDLRAKLERETDLLRYYINSAKGNPKNRAKLAAEIAKRSVLSKAVTQRLS